MHLTTLLAFLANLATLASASPILPSSFGLSHPLLPRTTLSAADIILKIMPTSDSCTGATGAHASDCRTNVQAAPYLIASLLHYNLTAPPQIAALLALIGYESSDLKYKHNISPGRAGQGTSAMLMPDNVAAYAASIPELKDEVAAAAGDVSKVLELVVGDEYNFGAGAWWLTAVCGRGVVEGLAEGASDAAWGAYMGCVGVSATDEGRLAYWGRAKEAFGL
ncbi:hypothetical protein CONLIGDRAFT_675362 [Coniochaeta ligniaria NRRL 30616]|uniref:Uncharacterized protein n=1 Tax=Coniochaeta ligniaria NRRL 30616 TaxID=1408157 RepID=A0A1J7J4J3_9PEZI|nr:hypothetical protein CONLIGDRAFT_675362 [Coniochaeta ligniaria NRRL 30616]